MVKTIEKSEFLKKVDEVMNDVKNNGITYIICINTIPFVKICPLNETESKLSMGVSYQSSILTSISEDF